MFFVDSRLIFGDKSPDSTENSFELKFGYSLIDGHLADLPG